MTKCSVSTVPELLAAVADPHIQQIVVTATLTDVPSFRLAPSQELYGSRDGEVALHFVRNRDGVCLSTDNIVRGLGLCASVTSRAVLNDSAVEAMGHVTLADLHVIGQVQLLARDRVTSGHIEVDGLHIVAADTRTDVNRPSAYGVSVLQAAFTLWNQQTSDAVTLTAALRNLSVGRAGAPVMGSGILVCGAGESGGRVQVETLTTGSIHSNGGIAPGTADLISGGVFVAYGCMIDLVHTLAPVTTYGPNDMALDNWGRVERWISAAKITTHGDSGIGFVNFGELGLLRVEAPIETFGQGARGFNVYTGTVSQAEFDRIVTHGDGAVGVQVAQPVGTLTFLRGIETFGATGPSLVKGVVQQLSATALSIRAGGEVQKLTIRGGLKTNAHGVPPLEQLGIIRELHIEDGFTQSSSN